MSEFQYHQNDTEPSPRRNRSTLRALLMIIIAGLILLLILLLLSTLVSPTQSDTQAPPTEAMLDATKSLEAPQPAVVALDSSTEDTDTNPEAFPETGNQYIEASGSSSGLFGQLTQGTSSDVQLCADELEYTARIDDVWDIWDLIFFTIYSNRENPSTSPPACQQLASEFTSNGRAEFITALGADWWPESSLSNASLSPSTCATPTECELRQEAVNLLTVEGNTALLACQNELLPPGLCSESVSAMEQECAERFDWTGNSTDLREKVEEEYEKNFGDIPQACTLYAGLPFLANETIQETVIGIQSGATCASQGLNCDAIENPRLDTTQAQTCALDIQWAGPISDQSNVIELLEYLAVAAPWLPPGSMPPSCTQFLISASPTEAGGAYWELLGKTLSERRIDSSP